MQPIVIKLHIDICDHYPPIYRFRWTGLHRRGPWGQQGVRSSVRAAGKALEGMGDRPLYDYDYDDDSVLP